MALRRCQRLVDRQRAQRDALVELHVVADDGGLADDDTGAVVDDHGVPERRAGVDVDARPFVGPLGQHARQDRHAEFVEAVGDAVDGDGLEAGVRQDHLVNAFGRGVAALDGSGVDHQLAVYLRKRTEEGGRDLGRVVDVAFERPQQGTEFRRGCVEGVAHLACCRRRLLGCLGEESVHETTNPRRDPCFGQARAAAIGENAVQPRGQAVERIARGPIGLVAVGDRSKWENHWCLGNWCRRGTRDVRLGGGAGRVARREAHPLQLRGASGGR